MAFIKKDWDETTPITPAELDRMETQYDEAVAWAKGFGLGDVAKDISNTDLNNLSAIGFYMGQNVANAPTTDWFYFISLHYVAGAYTTQMALSLSDPSNVAKTYVRMRQGGTWGAWQQLETTAGAQAKADQAEQDAVNWAKSFGLGDNAKDISGTDLNDLSATGFFKGANMTNAPLTQGYVLNVQYQPGYSFQFFYNLTSAGDFEVFKRQEINSAWGAWYQQETTAGAQAKADQAEQDAKDWAYLLNGDRVLDTRNTNEPPSYYYTIGPRTHHEFKQASVIGVGTGGGHYSLLITYCPWTDASGGTVKQTAYDALGNVFYRQSTNETTWGAWQTLATTGNTAIDQRTYANDANAISKTGFYVVDADWVGSPYPGTDGANQGYLEHQEWISGAYATQTFTSVNVELKKLIRYKDNGVWSAWKRLAVTSDIPTTPAQIGAIGNINGKTGTNITLTTSDIDDSAQSMPLNDIIEDLYGGKLSSAGGSISGDLTFSETKGPILNDLDTTKKYRLVVKSGQLYLQEA